MPSPKPNQVFTAIIHKAGINPYVSIPLPVSAAFFRHGYIPVKGYIEKFPIKANLVPVGNNRYRLYVNGDMRKGAQVTVGDHVTVRLDLDTQPRILPEPKALKKALAKNPRERDIWCSIRPSQRREILLYLNYLKSAEAIERNAKKVIAMLKNKAG